jgi:2-polyprenyl-6-hydroxyphenyl methylase/3-demethylubiquinone-9 3-methyltransferase
MSATDVPPNFITSRAISVSIFVVRAVFHRCSKFGPAEWPPARKGAYTYRRPRCAATGATGFQDTHCRDRNTMTGSAQTDASAASVDPREIDQFSRIAETWWDPRGPMAALHKFNPVRLAYIRDQAAARFGRDTKRLDSLAGLRMLDIGCGGGILSEPLARLGASMVGADPAERNIAVARAHAEQSGVAVDYRCTTAEALSEAGDRFDIVLAMEVVEHVNDVPAFVAACAAMVKPGGLMIAATLNRTMKSFALAIVGAEYVLRWLPRGTHQWDKFVTPDELAAALAGGGLAVTEKIGVVYNLLADRWQLAGDTDVNYMMVAANDEP